MHYSKIQIVLFFLLGIQQSICQNIQIDTLFHANNRIEITSKRNNLSFGSTKIYDRYKGKSIIRSYHFYLDGKRYGLDLEFFEGYLFTITNYRADIPIFSKTYYLNGSVRETLFPTILKTNVAYNKFQKIESIEYPDLKEAVTFHPNQSVKSIVVTDSSKKEIERKYYEFSTSGVLQIEGTYADSFIEVRDTIVTYDPETYEEIWQVIVEDVPLKNGDWFYYSEKGILEEKKRYQYYTDRKSKLIKN